MILYGLGSCESCRAARRALAAAGQAPGLRDLRAEPLSQGEAEALLARFGPRLVNRASATWRGLEAAARDLPPAALLAAHPAVMKRPVILAEGGRASLGWDAAARAVWGL